MRTLSFTRRRRGLSLIEVSTVAGVLGLLAAVISMTWIAVIKSYDSVTTQTYTSADAVTAMQRIVTDVREAKAVPLLDSGARLRVQFPITETGGYYDRHEADPNNVIDYYRSDSSGVVGRSGTILWRNKSNGAEMREIARDVDSVVFEADTSRSVKITVIASNPSVAGTKQTELTQRVVYLRNY